MSVPLYVALLYRLFSPSIIVSLYVGFSNVSVGISTFINPSVMVVFINVTPFILIHICVFPWICFPFVSFTVIVSVVFVPWITFMSVSVLSSMVFFYYC